MPSTSTGSSSSPAWPATTHVSRSSATSGRSSRAGLATPDVWIWAVEEDGRRVGTVFLGRRGGDLWLYDITIEADERCNGYGRGAMLALEKEVRSLGHDSVTLNVWGGNAVARGLYRSLGYVEESVHMRKRL